MSEDNINIINEKYDYSFSDDGSDGFLSEENLTDEPEDLLLKHNYDSIDSTDSMDMDDDELDMLPPPPTFIVSGEPEKAKSLPLTIVPFYPPTKKENQITQITFIDEIENILGKLVNNITEQKLDSVSEFIEVEDDVSDSFEEVILDIKNFNGFTSLTDLINLSLFLQDKQTRIKEFRRIRDMLPELQELDSLTGMKQLKDSIVKQIFFYTQELYDDEIFPHTVISGPPGCGKSTVARILGKIYLKMGFLKNQKFINAKRSDLIAGYLGQTAIKTQKKIDEASGGVLFIDEVYSLGSNTNEDDRDSFSKECIDTINLNLSEKRDFVCIVAGYQEELERSFFSKNPGLKRRFNWNYNIDGYSPEELREILNNKIIKHGWVISEEIPLSFFIQNKRYFKYFGGSIELFLQKIKIQHSLRVFGLPEEFKKVISKDDILSGFELLQEMYDFSDEERRDIIMKTMYV